VAVGKLIVEHDGDGIVLVLELGGEGRNLVLWDLETRPAVPLEGRCLGQSTQTTDQTSGGHGHLELAFIGALDGDGQAI
jgi:hypothetical protein